MSFFTSEVCVCEEVEVDVGWWVKSASASASASEETSEFAEEAEAEGERGLREMLVVAVVVVGWVRLVLACA